jgi:serine/threonine-protein kinase HipA
VTRTWQAVAQEVGCGRAEIARMASAFEHDDLCAALRL